MSKRRTPYADFKERIDRLARSLLPADVPSGAYTDKDKDQIHAYIVLAHAEIEEFLENMARAARDKAERESSPPKCSPMISRLILYKSLKGSEKIEAITNELISDAVAYHENLVKQNNGIKAENLFKIFMPLGLTHSDFDEVLMLELNAFGILRGGIAHTAARLQQGTSPSKERRTVESIVEEISHLDQRVRQLK